MIGNGAIIERDENATTDFRLLAVTNGMFEIYNVILRNGKVNGVSAWARHGGALLVDEWVNLVSTTAL